MFEGENNGNSNRCDLMVKALIDSVLKVFFLAIVLIIAMVCLLRQYSQIMYAKNHKLPLDDPNYPVPSHMAPWFREKLLKED